MWCSYLFHYIREAGIIYLCMGDEAFGTSGLTTLDPELPFVFMHALLLRNRRVSQRSTLSFPLVLCMHCYFRTSASTAFLLRT